MTNTELENASKIIFNNQEAEAIYLGNELLWSSVPYDAEIEYLESLGYQYINTNIIGNGQYNFKIKFICNSLGSLTDGNSATILGSRYSYSSRAFQLSTYRSGCFGYGYNANLYMNLGIDSTNTEYIVEKHDNKLYINNIEVLTITNISYETPNTLLLFALYQNSNVVEKFIGRIYYFILYDINNNIIMNLIPVRKDGVGYMYDKVSKQLFSNQGTGDFILGPDK